MKQGCLILLLTLLPLAAAAQSAVPEGFRSPPLETMKTKDLSMLWIGPIPLIDREDTTTLAWCGEFIPSEKYRSNGWDCGDKSAQAEETRRGWLGSY